MSLPNLFKGIYAEWIVDNFNLNYQPIFLVRNPIDTCISQLNTFSKWIGKEEQRKRIANLRKSASWKDDQFLSNLDSSLENQIAI